VDITLYADWGTEVPYVTALLEHFESRIPDAREFALERAKSLLTEAS
jgi:hypothetical protein